MGNAPIVMLSARSFPPGIEERYMKWWEAAYLPLYMKSGVRRAVDIYKIVKTDYLLPTDIYFYHSPSLEAWAKDASDPASDRNAAIRDVLKTFNMIERFWFRVYELMGSFRNAPSPQRTTDNTIVNDAQFIHIEGYRIPQTEYEKCENWFNQLASRIYIPLLLRIQGVKACNVFSLSDYLDPSYAGYRFSETDMPHYMSIVYFENSEAVDKYYQSIELAAFKRSLEVEFAGKLRTIWNTEYRLFKSYRSR